MQENNELSPCPVAVTARIIGNAWKILILRNLAERPWRFMELKRDLEGISQKVLAEALRGLGRDGIVVRTAYAEMPPRVEYTLSDMGRSLAPVLKAMDEWGRAYKKWRRNGAPPERLQPNPTGM